MSDQQSEERASIRSGQVTVALLMFSVLVMLCVGGSALAEWLKAGTP